MNYKFSNTLRYTYIALFLAMAMSLSGEAVARNNSHDLETFDLKDSRYFSDYNAVVSRYLQQNSSHRRARACVVGVRTDGQRDDKAWVIWRGGDRLILWSGGGDDDSSLSVRQLSLRRDVVANDAATGTSTYLVGRPWVKALERKCTQWGRYVTEN